MMELNKFESNSIEVTIAECLNRSARTIGRSASILAVAFGLILAAPSAPASAAIPAYTLVGSYSKAVGSGGEGAAFDVDAQGRMVIMNGNQIYRQDAVNGSAFSPIGSVPAGFVDSFSGASFIRFSPDGTRLAIGNGVFGAGGRVGVVGVAGLSTAGSSPIMWTPMDNFLATWADNQTLLVSGGAGVGAVFSPADNSAISGRVIINGIDGASGGVAFNGTHIFAGNGFDFSPGSGSNTGEIRTIPLATALASPTPIDFEAGGGGMAPIARVLSASPMEFDPFGNLLVGGGDVFGGGALAISDTRESSMGVRGPQRSRRWVAEGRSRRCWRLR